MQSHITIQLRVRRFNKYAKSAYGYFLVAAVVVVVNVLVYTASWMATVATAQSWPTGTIEALREALDRKKLPPIIPKEEETTARKAA